DGNGGVEPIADAASWQFCRREARHIADLGPEQHIVGDVRKASRATRAPRPTKVEPSKLDVAGAKRLKTRSDVKQLTHVRRCGSYMVGLFGVGRRWSVMGFLQRPKHAGVKQIKASSNTALWTTGYRGDSLRRQTPQAVRASESLWPIASPTISLRASVSNALTPS